MNAIKKNNQVRIYKILINQWDLWRHDQEHSIRTLQNIWDLSSMPSTDARYDNALGDLVQHYFNNNDWSTDYLFRERFNVYESNEVFLKFIEALLYPENYDDTEHLSMVSDEVDSILSGDNLRLVTEAFSDQGLPIQKVKQRTEDNDLPQGVKRNDIPFYIIDGISSFISEDEYFTLDPNRNWNDYGVVSMFELAYYKNGSFQAHIGYFKIIHEEENLTYTKLQPKFLNLGNEFCSLSSEEGFYQNLKEILGENGMISVLYALRDAAYFSDICDTWESNSNFKHSLIRDNGAERMLRDLKPILKGHDLSKAFHFSYSFQPAYSQIPIKVSLDFDHQAELPNRIFAVIGKNGTGKTQLMNSLPTALSKNIEEDFFKKIPSFSKIIAVSYSVFDTFRIPKKNAAFNYVYCGLKDEDGDIRSNKGLKISFHNNWKKIDDLRRLSRWRDILVNVIEEELVDQFIVVSKDYDRDFEVSIKGFHNIQDQLSSGQSILLYILTQVVANIRVDSLILYDEPETHLHPNAIVALMNSIYELVNEFESFCLIATHSPLVIRELFSKNVFVLKREDNVPSLQRIGIESFGENLGVLNDEVFGDRQVPKQYKKIIENFIEKGMNFNQIVDLLESPEAPLSLNARIYISNLIQTRNEEF